MNNSAPATWYADPVASNESEAPPPLQPTTDFVGRDAEMKELLVGLANAQQRAGGLFLLVGESGIGKTRLADELCATAADRGFATHWGRCWESGGAPAYWPWVQIFTALVNDGTLALPDGVSCDPVALAPGSREPSCDPPQPGVLPAATATQMREARFRTFRGTLALLAQAARRQPLVLVLDDLHAADQSSLLLLQFIARELRGMRLVIIGIHREQDPGLDPDVDSLLARIAREGRALPIRRLGLNAVDALVRRRMFNAPDATVAAIFQATHGNPLFLDQVIRNLQVFPQADGIELSPLTSAGDAPIDTHPAATPPSVAIQTPIQPAFELRREGEFWSVSSAEAVIRLRHSCGLETLDRLLREPDREFHVTELAAVTRGPTDLGDSGELLDREARAAYQSRLTDLREQVEEAESMGDDGRARRAQDEIDFLAAELARAVGLSGRARRAGNAADRARVTVQKRIRTAIGRIEAGAPSLGRYLSLTVQTGTFCVFRPTRPMRG